MAGNSSFDIVSQTDMQAADDAVNTAVREIKTRYDLKDLAIEVSLDKTAKTVTVTAPADFQLRMVKDILFQKFVKRGISPKALSVKSTEAASGGAVREVNTVISGIEMELAKKIAADIRDLKLKVQASIQGEQLRVSGPSKDDLQKAIAFVKGKDYPIPLQFVNYR
ncbi:MAG: YajQ family cyclic di-GMP-binding protein [Spirochaetota bacterium]